MRPVRQLQRAVPAFYLSGRQSATHGHGLLLVSRFASSAQSWAAQGRVLPVLSSSAGPDGNPCWLSGRMPEYTYLLDTRLTQTQRNALAQVRDAARSSGMTIFLAGGAVRDLTTGSSVRDLDFSVQGNALELEQAITERGGTLWGRHDASRTLFFWFPGSVRVEVASTRAESFPKPGQPQYSWSGIVDDLHRRDFTANAMALSLNEGSYGLLLDPLNGVADIEARQLRLVSNYGFIEDFSPGSSCSSQSPFRLVPRRANPHALRECKGSRQFRGGFAFSARL